MTNRERKLKIQRQVNRQADKLKQAGTDSAIGILQVLPIYVLAYKYNFGNIRLEKFVREFHRLTRKVQENEDLLRTIINELEHDKGIRIDIHTGNVDNLWRDEGDVRKVVNKPKKG